MLACDGPSLGKGRPAAAAQLGAAVQASDIIRKGKMCSLFINDLDAGAGRMGDGTQYTVNNQMVNATLMNIADNPTNVQLPGVYKNVSPAAHLSTGSASAVLNTRGHLSFKRTPGVDAVPISAADKPAMHQRRSIHADGAVRSETQVLSISPGCVEQPACGT